MQSPVPGALAGTREKEVEPCLDGLQSSGEDGADK